MSCKWEHRQLNVARMQSVIMEWCEMDLERKVRVSHGHLCTMVMSFDVTLWMTDSLGGFRARQ